MQAPSCLPYHDFSTISTKQLCLSFITRHRLLSTRHPHELEDGTLRAPVSLPEKAPFKETPSSFIHRIKTFMYEHSCRQRHRFRKRLSSYDTKLFTAVIFFRVCTFVCDRLKLPHGPGRVTPMIIATTSLLCRRPAVTRVLVRSVWSILLVVYSSDGNLG